MRKRAIQKIQAYITRLLLSLNLFIFIKMSILNSRRRSPTISIAEVCIGSFIIKSHLILINSLIKYIIKTIRQIIRKIMSLHNQLVFIIMNSINVNIVIILNRVIYSFILVSIFICPSLCFRMYKKRPRKGVFILNRILFYYLNITVTLIGSATPSIITLHANDSPNKPLTNIGSF